MKILKILCNLISAILMTVCCCFLIKCYLGIQSHESYAWLHVAYCIHSVENTYQNYKLCRVFDVQIYKEKKAYTVGSTIYIKKKYYPRCHNYLVNLVDILNYLS